MALIRCSTSSGGGGITQSYKGDTVPSDANRTVNCGFAPKVIIIYCLISGQSGQRVSVWNTTTADKYDYYVESAKYLDQNLSSPNELISVTSTGFTLNTSRTYTWIRYEAFG